VPRAPGQSVSRGPPTRRSPHPESVFPPLFPVARGFDGSLQPSWPGRFFWPVACCEITVDPDRPIEYRSISSVTEDVISVMNELIEAPIDGELGFHAAAEDVARNGVKQVFQKYFDVHKFGDAADERDSITGAVCRRRSKLRAADSARDDVAILKGERESRRAGITSVPRGLFWRISILKFAPLITTRWDRGAT
jgi:hypothetical protein